MLTNKRLYLQMIGVELMGIFLSILILFSYEMIVANDSSLFWVEYVGTAFTIIAYVVLVYGWMWSRGAKDKEREEHAPGCYGKNRGLKTCVAMLVPGFVISAAYAISVFAAPSDGFAAAVNTIHTLWYAPFFRIVFAIRSNHALIWISFLCALVAPVVAFIAYTLGHAGISLKAGFLKFLPQKPKEEFPEENPHIAKDILTDENYENIFNEKPPKE